MIIYVKRDTALFVSCRGVFQILLCSFSHKTRCCVNVWVHSRQYVSLLSFILVISIDLLQIRAKTSCFKLPKYIERIRIIKYWKSILVIKQHHQQWLKFCLFCRLTDRAANHIKQWKVTSCHCFLTWLQLCRRSRFIGNGGNICLSFYLQIPCRLQNETAKSHSRPSIVVHSFLWLCCPGNFSHFIVPKDWNHTVSSKITYRPWYLWQPAVMERHL
jgi:hypothetical protein